ncbi:MAG TPA: 3'-5' exonuclease [Spirochaetota bacterium]|nr:3'-5' exonuclease [Spirochaetota bacterium]HOH36447.1 3'-5' exonuclease [Spirochaetota bacterium]HPJ13855.1 3'-5' exonuclease [Spirochaetota bacterium]HPM33384.1 3'-5' exonuclease [Spirochaetota bacterium]HPY02195.1 3'-5' exonuclease [Spirochaetota bacterium]
MDILESLNESQKEAVLATEGPLLIFAGAGSGKTKVITHRIAHLIREKRVPPYKIFAVTFTNKAAGEMKKRISSIIGGSGDDVFVKTFHSASVYILRRFGEQIGIHPNYSIYDTSDQESIVKAILGEMNIDVQKYAKRVISKISEVKDKAELIEGADPYAFLPKEYAVNYTEIYDEYNKRLRAANALDFNDLLIYAVKLLRDSPEVIEALQNKWSYFMIDEYQDTNRAQYMMAKYLAAKSRNICVVGDDDQSIYSWRGADISNILNFEKDYPEAKVVKLETNYRSTSYILDAAYSVVKNNRTRKDKRLNSFRGEGFMPVYCETNNEYGEAEFVVNTIRRLKREENLQYGNFAVFYRTNAQSRLLEDTLRHEAVPYRIIGSVKFYERKEIKDIVSYLRFVVNPCDTASLDRIINNPPRGIGARTVEKLKETAYAEQMSEWEIIDKDINIDGKVNKGLKQFKEIINSLINLYVGVPDKISLADFVEKVITVSTYRKHLEESSKADSTGKEHDRLENIDEFINSAIEYEERTDNPSLEEFLQEISLLTSEENPENKQAEAVTLMTIHNAKGLEFNTVFLTGLEEGTFPHANSLNSDAQIEEERRLAYVGITRAMDRLYIISADVRRQFHQTVYRQASRFISEIDNELLERTRYTSAGSSSYSDYSESYSPVSGSAKRVSGGAKFSSQYSRGDLVKHPKYGNGKIVNIENSGDDTTLTVSFPGSGMKVFIEKYTPLVRI